MTGESKHVPNKFFKQRNNISMRRFKYLVSFESSLSFIFTVDLALWSEIEFHKLLKTKKGTWNELYNCWDFLNVKASFPFNHESGWRLFFFRNSQINCSTFSPISDKQKKIDIPLSTINNPENKAWPSTYFHSSPSPFNRAKFQFIHGPQDFLFLSRSIINYATNEAGNKSPRWDKGVASE